MYVDKTLYKEMALVHVTDCLLQTHAARNKCIIMCVQEH